MKKSSIIILIIVCCITIIYLKNTQDLQIDVSNNVDESLINWDEYGELNDEVYISSSSNKVSGLLLKLDSSFEIQIDKNTLQITYDKKDIYDEYKLHYVKIVNGDVKNIIINNNNVFHK